jgi:hypothetical protein
MQCAWVDTANISEEVQGVHAAFQLYLHIKIDQMIICNIVRFLVSLQRERRQIMPSASFAMLKAIMRLVRILIGPWYNETDKKNSIICA